MTCELCTVTILPDTNLIIGWYLNTLLTRLTFVRRRCAMRSLGRCSLRLEGTIRISTRSSGLCQPSCVYGSILELSLPPGTCMHACVHENNHLFIQGGPLSKKLLSSWALIHHISIHTHYKYGAIQDLTWFLMMCRCMTLAVIILCNITVIITLFFLKKMEIHFTRREYTVATLHTE